jgi:hypothetical protein
MAHQPSAQDEHYLFADCIHEQSQVAVAERLHAARKVLNRFGGFRRTAGTSQICLSHLTGLTDSDVRVVGLAAIVSWGAFNGDMDLYDPDSVSSYCADFSALPDGDLLVMTSGFASALDPDEFHIAAAAVKELWPVISIRAEYQFQMLRAPVRPIV